MDTNRPRRRPLKTPPMPEVAHTDSPAVAASLRASAIVVGAGAFGGWSALQLLQRGAKVTLLDAWGPEIHVPAQAVRLESSAPLMVL